MLQREIGNSGIMASAVGLGTWAIGGGPWWGPTDDKESVRAIHAALDSGISLIDTAPVYGFGRSEEVVGEALRGRRDKAVVATKCGLWWDDARGSLFFDLGGTKVFKSLLPETVRKEVYASLRRLKIDYIDLYQTHWQAVEPVKTPVEDTMAALLDLKRKGLIRAIGVSNVSPSELEAYLDCGGIVSAQEKFSMLDPKIVASGLLDLCVRRNVSLLAYSPLEQGLLTGRIGMDRTFSDAEYRSHIPWFRPESRRKVLDMLKGWEPLTGKLSCTMAQLVVAWTLSRPGVTFALCGARHPEQAMENARAGDLALPPEDIGRMDADIASLFASS